jgi:predicted DsbA family dithiol-disulfide isomerase
MINPIIARNPRAGDSASPALLQVDVIADLVCPWCYLGKRRLDDALLAVHGPSAVTWYPFQLNPDIPEAGLDFEEYLAGRFGDPVAVEPVLAELTAAGKAEGINFRFERIRRIPNSINAHRVMKLAEAAGANATDVAENTLRAFFEDGMDISARDVLVAIGEGSGLGSQLVNATLDDEATRQAVLSQEAQVRQSGVTGVPDFLINKRLFVIGAQSTESLVNVFDRAMFGEESDLPVSPTIH